MDLEKITTKYLTRTHLLFEERFGLPVIDGKFSNSRQIIMVTDWDNSPDKIIIFTNRWTGIGTKNCTKKVCYEGSNIQEAIDAYNKIR